MATDVKNDSTLSTSLVSYWELEESSGTRVDSHGSNDLTDNNTVTSGTGIQGTAADFEDANSEYLTDPNTGQYDVTSGSVSVWVKIENFSVGTISPGIWSTTLSNASATGGVTLRYSYIDKKVNFYVGNSGGGYTESTTALTTGTWYHIVATWTPSAIKVYVNGSNEGTDSTVSTVTAGTTLHIGKDAPNARYFDGLIDEVGFWSKELSSTEVTDLYNSGSGIPYDAGGAASTFTPRVMMVS